MEAHTELLKLLCHIWSKIMIESLVSIIKDCNIFMKFFAHFFLSLTISMKYFFISSILLNLNCKSVSTCLASLVNLSRILYFFKKWYKIFLSLSSKLFRKNRFITSVKLLTLRIKPITPIQKCLNIIES